MWWGPRWEPPPERTIVDLTREGLLSPAVAALLWGMMARRASVIVAAGPSGAGKTTLLSALLDCWPAATRRLYLRGCYESFAFLDDPGLDPARTGLLINEISAHLPAYLWGPAVRRAFAAAQRGFGLAATAHATSAADLIGLLAGYPLRVPIAALAAIDLVILLAAEPESGRIHRRIDGVWLVLAGQERGLRVEALASGHDISLDLLSHHAHAASPLIPNLDEIAERSRLLTTLLARPGPPDATTVRHFLGGYLKPASSGIARAAAAEPGP